MSFKTAAQALSPRALWLPGEASGSTVADESANSYDGTLVGSPAPSLAGGPGPGLRSYLPLNGSSQYVSLTTLSGWGPNIHTSTIAMWVRCEETTSPNFMFGTVNDGTSVILIMRAHEDANASSDQNKFHIHMREDAAGTFRAGVASDTDIFDGNWHFLVMRFQADLSTPTATIRIDGVDTAVEYSSTQRVQQDDTAELDYPLYLGVNNSRGTTENHTDMDVAAFALWDANITDDEADELYVETLSTGVFKTTALALSPRGLWLPGELPSSTVADLANSNDGSLVGSPVRHPSGGPGEGLASFIELNGTDEYLSLSTLAGWAANLPDATIAMWVRVHEQDTNKALFGTTNDGTDTILLAETHRDENDSEADRETNLFLRDSDGDTLRFSNLDNDLYDGDWHLLVYRLNANQATPTVTIRFDELPYTPQYGDRDQIASPSDFDYPLLVGALNDRGTPASHSQIDVAAVAVWDTRLTDGQADSLFTSAGTPPYEFSPPYSIVLHDFEGYSGGASFLGGHDPDTEGFFEWIIEDDQFSVVWNTLAFRSVSNGLDLLETDFWYNLKDRGFSIHMWVHPDHASTWETSTFLRPIRLKNDNEEDQGAAFKLLEGDTLIAEKGARGSPSTIASDTYDPVAHRYLRIRESGGDWFYEVSPDNWNWTQFATTSHTLSDLELGQGEMQIEMNSGIGLVASYLGLLDQIHVWGVEKEVKTGTVEISGSATIEVTDRHVGYHATASVEADGLVEVTGRHVGHHGAATVGGVGSVEVDNHKAVLRASASVEGAGSISATGQVSGNFVGEANVDGAATIEATAKVTHYSGASVDGVGSITASGVVLTTKTGTASIQATATITATPLPLSGVDVEIGGNSYIPRNDTLRVGRALEERAVCDFQIVDKDNEYDFHKGQPIAVTINGTVLFGGVIEFADRQYFKANDTTIWTIACIDYTYLADRRIVADTYTATTVGAIVTDLISKLSADGVTAGTVDTGPDVTEVVFAYIPITRALNALAERSGFGWRINPDKTLDFKDRAALSSTLNVKSHAKFSSPPHVEERAPDYRNRQYVVGGRDITDEQVESFVGDGERSAFTVGFPIAKVPTVKLNTVAETVGIKGIETGKDWYWNKGDNTLSQDNAGTILTGSDTLEVTYQGIFDVVTISEDFDAQQDRKDIEGFGTGRIDNVIEESQSTSRAESFELAAGALGLYTQIGRRLTFLTQNMNYDPGELITADLPEWGLDDIEMLVESCETEVPSKDNFWTTVVAVEGPIEGSWTRFFSRMSERTSVLAFRENIGDNEILTLLNDTEEAHERAEVIDQTVYACPVFDSNGDIFFSDPGGEITLC